MHLNDLETAIILKNNYLTVRTRNFYSDSHAVQFKLSESDCLLEEHLTEFLAAVLRTAARQTQDAYTEFYGEEDEDDSSPTERGTPPKDPKDDSSGTPVAK